MPLIITIPTVTYSFVTVIAIASSSAIFIVTDTSHCLPLALPRSMLTETLPCPPTCGALYLPPHGSRPFSFSFRTPKFSPLSRRRRPTRFLPRASRQSFVSPSKPTLYELLELTPDVGISDIKHAYRQMARKYHPDVCQSEESTRRFIEIQEAYETLSDPRRRAIYDRAVAMGLGPTASGRMPWNMSDEDTEPLDWRSRWESQLSGLKHRSAMKGQRADSWASRVRTQNDR